MITDDGECLACDNTGLATIEERRGLDLDDRVVPCPECRADDFADAEPDRDRPYNGERDPDYAGSYRERIVAAFGASFIDDLEAA